MRFKKETFPPISIDPTSRTSLSVQIFESAIQCIRRGRLSPGQPMPSQKSLADHLGVSYTTVVTAYSRLLAHGWIEMRWRSGTHVVQNLPILTQDGAKPTAHENTAESLAFDLPTRRDLATSQLVRIAALSEGLPDPRLMPKDEMGLAYRNALLETRTRWQSAEQGDGDLRYALGQFLHKQRNMTASPEQILVTRGNRTALNLLAKGLLNPGDRVAVEDPGNPAVWELFREAGAALCGIAVDKDGLDPAALEQCLQTQPIRMLYLTPRYQFPTTATLSVERRERLVALAERHRFWIVEEDSEADFLLEGTATPPLAAEGTSSRLIYLYSFSRLMAPGVRLGLISGSADLIARLTGLSREGSQDAVMERTMALLFANGEIGRHILRACKTYRERRDITAACLQEIFGTKLDLVIPSGGLSFWIQADPAIDLEQWCRSCTEWEIRFQAGRFYALDKRPIQALRLGFAKFDPSEIARILVQMHDLLPK